MADNYDDIRGMQFPYITIDGEELSACYVAAISDDGLTIKCLDLEEMDRAGYRTKAGTKEEGNMTCYNNISQPHKKDIFLNAVKYLREIKRGDRKVYDAIEFAEMNGVEPFGLGGLISCAF